MSTKFSCSSNQLGHGNTHGNFNVCRVFFNVCRQRRTDSPPLGGDPWSAGTAPGAQSPSPTPSLETRRWVAQHWSYNMLNNVKKCHKSSINGPFSIAMLNNQKVYIYICWNTNGLWMSRSRGRFIGQDYSQFWRVEMTWNMVERGSDIVLKVWNWNRLKLDWSRTFAMVWKRNQSLKSIEPIWR